jgi:DNA-binding transcriptional LysR family regulator
MTRSRTKRLNFKEVTLAQLRTFCEVCRLGGYAAAARSVLLTTPAVWEQMQALERHFGMTLLERSGSGMRPTIHGQRLLGMIQPLLAGFESTRESLHQLDGMLPPQLTLVTNLRVLVDDISRGLRRFQQQYPQIKLRVLYTGITEVEPLFLSGEADVAFTLEQGPERLTPQSVAYEAAAEVDYLLVAPPRHPVLRQRRLELTQIARYPLVLGEPAAYSRRRVSEVLHRYDLTQAQNVAVETSSDEYTLACVRAGMGIGITIGTGRGHLYRGLGVRSLRRWFGTARVGFLWKQGAYFPPVHRELADSVRVCVNERSG